MSTTINSNYDLPDAVDALSKFDKNAIRLFLKKSPRPNLDHIPVSKGMPLVGHMYWFTNDTLKWLEDQYKQFGPVFKLKAMNREVVMLLGPDANRLLLQNEDKVFSNFLAYGPTIKNLLDDNVLSLDFAHHKHTRKTLQAAFKQPAVEGHIELMNPMIQNGLNNWPLNKTIKSTQYIRKLLLDTGASVFLGLDMGKDAERMNQAFVDLVGGGAAYFRFEKIPFSPYAKALRARKVMEEFIYRSINERRKTGTEGRDIFSQLCNARDEQGNYLTDREVCNQIIFVLFAAHDTTSSALSSTFYALATNKAWQQELREEMFSLHKENLEFTDFDKLEKTGWTLQEALRMYPPAPFFPRYALKEFEFAGYQIPANTPLMGNAPFTHYMPEYWSHPYTFDPLRFSPERAEDKKDFFQYVPFGGGAHKCLGLHFSQVQGKMFLFHFLKNYAIDKNPKLKAFNYRNFPLTFPTDGLPLTFTRI